MTQGVAASCCCLGGQGRHRTNCAPVATNTGYPRAAAGGQSTSTERENSYVQRGKVQRGEAYLGEEQNGDKPGCGSENKVSIVAAASLDEAGQPIHVKVAKVETLSFAAIAYWAQDALARCIAWPERRLKDVELVT